MSWRVFSLTQAEASGHHCVLKGYMTHSTSEILVHMSLRLHFWVNGLAFIFRYGTYEDQTQRTVSQRTDQPNTPLKHRTTESQLASMLRFPC
jgi:hypothetical protein